MPWTVAVLGLACGCRNGPPRPVEDAAAPAPSRIDAALRPDVVDASPRVDAAGKTDCSAAESVAHPRPTCAPTEKVLLECHVSDEGAARVARVCGSRTRTPTEGHLAFVYGSLAKTDVEIDLPACEFGARARYARYTRPLVTGLVAAFRGDGKDFQLEQWWDDESARKPERFAQLWILDAAKDDREPLLCSPFPSQDLIALEDILPRSPDWVGGPLP